MASSSFYFSQQLSIHLSMHSITLKDQHEWNETTKNKKKSLFLSIVFGQQNRQNNETNKQNKKKKNRVQKEKECEMDKKFTCFNRSSSGKRTTFMDQTKHNTHSLWLSFHWNLFKFIHTRPDWWLLDIHKKQTKKKKDPRPVLFRLFCSSLSICLSTHTTITTTKTTSIIMDGRVSLFISIRSTYKITTNNQLSNRSSGEQHLHHHTL